jgi:hypothetical protein
MLTGPPPKIHGTRDILGRYAVDPTLSGGEDLDAPAPV